MGDVLVCGVTLATAVGTIVVGAAQSFPVARWLAREQVPAEAHAVTGRSALLFPLVGSASLLLLFFFFQLVSNALVLYMAVSSYASVYAAAAGLLGRTPLGAAGVAAGSTLLAVGLVALWLVTNHFLAIDLIGFSLCVTMISLLRLDSLRVGALAGLGLFVYDTFWVFFSHLFFKENVMVKVATQQASNPVQTIAQAVHLPGADKVAQSLELPIKFLFPVYTKDGVFFSMLGLGDVAIPGIFVCFCLRIDVHLRSKNHFLEQELEDLESATSLISPGETSTRRSPRVPPSPAGSSRRFSVRKYPYFSAALAGYTVGLVSAMVGVRAFGVAQPALFYIVPCALAPVLGVAYYRGQLRLLWKGLSEGDEAHRQ